MTLQAQEAEISNLRYEQQYSDIHITYDLSGSKDTYEIVLLLQRSGDPSSPYVPKNVTGDIGGDVTPGRGKRITWNVAEEFPEGIDPAEGFSLSMEAVVTIGFLQKYSLYLGGGALAAGAALYLLLSGDEVTSPSMLPDPYGRPEKW
jgi:hypothetical protein